MTVVQDRYRGTQAYLLAYAELIAAARYKGTTTYGRIARLTGLPEMGHQMAREVGWLLGEISDDEHRHGRPMLSAVATRADGTVGGGFYDLARALRKLESEDPEDEHRFWETERKRAYETWKP